MKRPAENIFDTQREGYVSDDYFSSYQEVYINRWREEAGRCDRILRSFGKESAQQDLITLQAACVKARRRKPVDG
jgi:hypothetical protein